MIKWITETTKGDEYYSEEQKKENTKIFWKCNTVNEIFFKSQWMDYVDVAKETLNELEDRTEGSS